MLVDSASFAFKCGRCKTAIIERSHAIIPCTGAYQENARQFHSAVQSLVIDKKNKENCIEFSNSGVQYTGAVSSYVTLILTVVVKSVV